MNYFDHKNLGNHLLQLCPKVVKHPVYVSRKKETDVEGIRRQNVSRQVSIVSFELKSRGRIEGPKVRKKLNVSVAHI